MAQRAKAIARLPVETALPELVTGPADSGTESEPEDINPLPDNDEGHEDGLDSSDDEGDDGEELQAFELPDGFQVAPAPSAAQLDYGDLAARTTLGNRQILYRWAGVGWCVGKLTPNTDGRRKVNGKVKNFWAYYEVDQKEELHLLSLEMYGQEGGPSAWVLLEPLLP